MTTSEVYQKHIENKKKVEQHNQSKAEDKTAKRVDKRKWWNSTAIVAPAPTDKYREGWDRIFGNARKDT